ncbi:MAG: hypothetical protein JO016_10895 [Actinobacteria bacterium]|nr:hypothetical protein [Actinomycetota bacterium]
MRAVTGPGRWIWGLSGLSTAAVLAVPGVRLITHAGFDHQHPAPSANLIRKVSLTQPITSMNVQSADGPVVVTAGSVRSVQLTEYISYDKTAGPPPAVQDSVSGGRLTLADPACAVSSCGVTFAVTVPATTPVSATVTSNGAPVSLTGLAGANVDSGGAPVTLEHISGPETVGTDGGSLRLNGLTGALHADTGGGPLFARDIDGPATITTDGGSLSLDGLTGTLQADSGGGPATALDVTAPTATVITGGGSGQLTFATAPATVTFSTDGGPATLQVPGGPYALNADSDGGPESVSIASSASAPRSLNVASGGGQLSIGAAQPPAG